MTDNKNSRLQSLDALRGLDMFWITSGEFLFHEWAKAGGGPMITGISNQLHHSPWNGCTFYDIIFPLFIFIAGLSMPYSLAKYKSNHGLPRNKIYRSLLRRTLLLVVLGMVVNGLLQWKGYENTRFASVLGRIGLACFFATILYLNTSVKGMLLWCAGILLGYWIALTCIPVPGFGAGNLTPEGNLSAYIDRLLLPGKLHRKVYDPEGLFSTLPAIVTALLGGLTGKYIRDAVQNSRTKAGVLLGAGMGLLALGWCWNLVFPVNKTLWSSSFVLVAGGWSLLLFVCFYTLIEIAGVRKWAMPFVWIGTNSILIYLLVHGVVDFETPARFLFGGWLNRVDPVWEKTGLAAGVMLVQFTLLYFLYRKKWFLKI